MTLVPIFARLAAAALLAAALVTPLPGWCQGVSPIQRASEALAAGKPAEAYALLAPLEGERAGERDFDGAFALAALDTDHLDRALAALERLLSRDPADDRARLELGRVYLRMGSLDLAALEFRQVLVHAPDAATRTMIEASLAQVEQQRARQRRALSGYIEAGGGRDTNVSSSTRDFPGAILSAFGLPGIAATGNSIRRADNFAAAAIGGDFAWRVAEERVAFAAADARWRGYRDLGAFDSTLADLVVGYQDRTRPLQWTVTAYGQAFRQKGEAVDAVDGTRIKNDRNAAGAALELRREVAARWQLAAGLQLSTIRYPANAGQDTDEVTLSLAAEWRPAAFAEGVLLAKVFAGHDEARRALGSYTDATASRRATGIRFAAFSDPSAQASWQAALGWSRRTDDDAFARATLVATGRDDLYEAYVQGSWRLGGGWSLQPYAAYTDNRSNIALYTFRKAEAGLVARREFR